MNKSALLKGLYAITPVLGTTGGHHQQLVSLVGQAIAGGARIIQFRDKSSDTESRLQLSKDLADLCRQQGVVYLVNDDVQLALDSGAHGVHLGAEDMPLPRARQILGQQAIIGVSCYNCFDLAQQAQSNGADYVAFGRFFPSRTKPQAVQADLSLLQRAQQLDVPVVAIGGINEDNARMLVSAGADMLAVIDAVFQQEDVQQASAALVACMA